MIERREREGEREREIEREKDVRVIERESIEHSRTGCALL